MGINSYLHKIEHNLDMTLVEIAVPFKKLKKAITWHEFKIIDYGEMYLFDCDLPDDGQEILTYDRLGYISIDTFYNNGVDCYLDSQKDFIDDVTHWMALPEAPQSD